jgi:hypothetical protein
MTKQLLLGGILGGLALFMWLGLSWAVLEIHTPALHSIPDEESALSRLKGAGLEHAVYIYPGMPPAHGDKAVMEAYNARAKAGPVIPFMVYLPQGYEPMDPRVMLRGLTYCIFAGLFVTFVILTAQRPRYLTRVGLAVCFGAVVALCGPLTFGNFFFFPTEFVWPEVLDQLVGWFLAGLVIAAFTRPSTEKRLAAAAVGAA